MTSIPVSSAAADAAALPARRTRLWWLLLAAVALLPLAAQALGQPFLVTLATRMLILGLAALSLDFLLGVAGLASLGHAAFFGLGAYLAAVPAARAAEAAAGSAWALLGGDLLAALPLVLIGCAAAGALAGAVALRTRGVHFIMITLALSQMLYVVLVALREFGGDEGLRLPQRQTLAGWRLDDPALFFWVCLGSVLAVLWAYERLAASRLGQLMHGARQNERRLQALGVDSGRVLLAAHVLAAMGAGVAGLLMANHGRFVSPELLHWSKSGELLVIVILGGVGSLRGALLGAAGLVAVEELVSAHSEYWQGWVGVLLLALVLWPAESRQRLWAACRNVWTRGGAA